MRSAALPDLPIRVFRRLPASIEGVDLNCTCSTGGEPWLILIRRGSHRYRDSTRSNRGRPTCTRSSRAGRVFKMQLRSAVSDSDLRPGEASAQSEQSDSHLENTLDLLRGASIRLTRLRTRRPHWGAGLVSLNATISGHSAVHHPYPPPSLSRASRPLATAEPRLGPPAFVVQKVPVVGIGIIEVGAWIHGMAISRQSFHHR
jgi:hypothetical protein